MRTWLIVALVLANLALAAWNLGAFARWGWGPDDGREPERLEQQIRPEAITLQLPASAAATAAAAASSPVSSPEPAASAPQEPASNAASSPTTRP